MVPVPGGTNAIASAVDLWLDVRHPDGAVTAAVVEGIHAAALAAASAEGCTVRVNEEFMSPTVHFDPALRGHLGGLFPAAPVPPPTRAGHDTGVLAANLPAAMLFVRSPTGVSHSPEEHVEDDDAEAGALALAEVLEGLAGPA